MKTPKHNDNYIHYDHESRIVRLETTIENINQTLIRFDNKFDKIDERFEKLEKEIKDNFRWTIGTIVFTFLVPILLKMFHVM